MLLEVDEYGVECDCPNSYLEAIVAYLTKKEPISIFVRHLGMLPLNYPLSVDGQPVQDDSNLRHSAGSIPDLFGGFWIESRSLLEVLSVLKVDFATLHFFSTGTFEWMADVSYFEEYLAISTVRLGDSEVGQILKAGQDSSSDDSALLSYDSTLSLVSLGQYRPNPLDASATKYPELPFITCIASFTAQATDYNGALCTLSDPNTGVIFTDALYQTWLEAGVMRWHASELQLPRTPLGLRQYLLLSEQLVLEAVLVWRPCNCYWQVESR